MICKEVLNRTAGLQLLYLVFCRTEHEPGIAALFVVDTVDYPANRVAFDFGRGAHVKWSVDLNQYPRGVAAFNDLGITRIGGIEFVSVDFDGRHREGRDLLKVRVDSIEWADQVETNDGELTGCKQGKKICLLKSDTSEILLSLMNVLVIVIVTSKQYLQCGCFASLARRSNTCQVCQRNELPPSS